MGWKIVINLGATAHAATHKDGGADEIKLNELGDPTASVDFNNQQLQKACIERLATAPSAVTGRIYYNETDGHFYVYKP
jgi:hypothetical protein